MIGLVFIDCFNLESFEIAILTLSNKVKVLMSERCIEPLRFSGEIIEFNFRDAKQHWGLEDFMVVNERPVYNSANLALFMVNVSQALMRPMRTRWPELSMNDLKTWFRSRKYVVETLKLLPEMPEAILIDQVIAQVAQLGRINQAVNPA
jgi:hypothetical protein